MRETLYRILFLMHEVFCKVNLIYQMHLINLSRRKLCIFKIKFDSVKYNLKLSLFSSNINTDSLAHQYIS